ncbi:MULTISPECIES: hypothetical protein [unclassified Campylobacter]|uniref:hypothetical protein n=1 Tax=unclassified Campylobacter TaxID=2593542 RepID=UPI0022E9EC2C|nr:MULTISPECIES: hypothetical protein [unclassified Campylobacter]MDA3055309.1 hypothetical protein [Campylobacter sp. VBCF_07 NA4]MDA3060573.1 hypothetical protein [Campylobacter sp. VBCF_02 NA5]MDA3070161.1 hypothetical protein [Campylobacter sp. VBCF_08 NA3]WBR54595.1 hypothetical protein PF027_01630 [Campylobacter sp. VBCF_01 NA2]
MWQDLPISQKNEYKKLILAFSSLTEMFVQKNTNKNTIPVPIINSKFQETVFQKAFKAVAEDIGNTSYDASLILEKDNGEKIKYLVGIKTFTFKTQEQKIAQFKANSNEWSSLISQIKDSAKNLKRKAEIVDINKDRYLELAKRIAAIRNARINSSKANLRGFCIDSNDTIESVYHTLMPAVQNNEPKIFVGETSYAEIDINNIKILSCTIAKKPENFTFTDDNHTYKYTHSDSQLYMIFNNSNIIKDEWKVIYVDNAYEIFSKIADEVYNKKKIVPQIAQSFSWKIELQPSSGFNSFYGIGLKKKGKEQRIISIKLFYNTFKGTINDEILNQIVDKLYLLANSNGKDDFAIRDEILSIAEQIDNDDFTTKLNGFLFRPINEIYIPIPHSKNFHQQNPNFFGKNIGLLDEKGALMLPKEQCAFDLVFDPSGTKIKAFITQDFGKAIQSFGKQSELGKWILREIFQLKEYEPLTQARLDEIGINGIRLYKLKDDKNVYFQFIYIDDLNLPNDFVS